MRRVLLIVVLLLPSNCVSAKQNIGIGKMHPIMPPGMFDEAQRSCMLADLRIAAFETLAFWMKACLVNTPSAQEVGRKTSKKRKKFRR